MELTYWWILPLAAAAVAVSTLLYLRRRRPVLTRAIAHGDRLIGLPEYRHALRRYRVRLVLAALLAGLFLAAAAITAARPAQRSTEQPEIRNRDIVLCLDVSGSMTSTDAALAAVFKDLAKEFDGERIGMVIFDSSSVQLFPLTDDYDYAEEQLTQAEKALADGAGSFFDGTWNGEGSSLIGDGLASCVQSFPDTAGNGVTAEDTKRSRSVVLATDNFVSGASIFSLSEAGALAAGKNVKVHALNPSDMDYGDDSGQPGAQLKATAEATGGTYSTLDSPDAVPRIVRQVQETEATAYLSAPRSVVADAPAWPLGVALLAGLGMLVLGRRLDR
ncbi:VWA domain-containing protein [Paenarthrobacter sp. Y-19]|uniref:vWA domain-containing protein n=1 Tax=unclassified Paenarthrobacter TaxID=2634190 RepID=UPI000377C48B|nr:VWA domain-containing protein [Paenarthrobacter sp. Y-19]